MQLCINKVYFHQVKYRLLQIKLLAITSSYTSFYISSFYLSFYLSLILSIILSIHIYINYTISIHFLSIIFNLYLPFYIQSYPSFYLSFYISFCPSIYLYKICVIINEVVGNLRQLLDLYMICIQSVFNYWDRLSDKE